MSNLNAISVIELHESAKAAAIYILLQNLKTEFNTSIDDIATFLDKSIECIRYALKRMAWVGVLETHKDKIQKPYVIKTTPELLDALINWSESQDKYPQLNKDPLTPYIPLLPDIKVNVKYAIENDINHLNYFEKDELSNSLTALHLWRMEIHKSKHYDLTIFQTNQWIKKHLANL